MDGAALRVGPTSARGGGEYAYLDLLGRVKKALDTAREVAVPASDIRRFPNQPRKYFNDDSIRRLSDSIDAGGQTTSGMIRKKAGDGQYEVVDLNGRLELRSKPGKSGHELIDGERRWRGVLLIPETRRPLYKAKLIEADDDVVRYLISGIANFNREGHTALEVMQTIDELVGFELPMKEIASLLGISESWAGQMHGLKKLAPEVRKLLDPKLPKPEQLPVVAAIQISKIEGKFQQGLAERVIRKDITLGRLRGEVVKVAQRAGSHIRIKDALPGRQWESFGNRVDVVLRTAGDAEDVLKKGEVNEIIRTRPDEVRGLLRDIKEARETLSRVEDLIHKARNKK